MPRLLAVSILLLLFLPACGQTPATDGADSSPAADGQITDDEREAVAAEVREVLDRQTDAWNEGDLVTFVADYLDSPRMRFVSGGSVRMGSADLLDRYRTNYPDRAAMGRLHFSDLDIRVLSRDFAFVFGRYNLERENDAPTGLFTLLFERTPEGLRIAHDHTSS